MSASKETEIASKEHNPVHLAGRRQTTRAIFVPTQHSACVLARAVCKGAVSALATAQLEQPWH
eukprot:5630384-Amphidinium_carterae.1